mgnify:CR=1 FL=1
MKVLDKNITILINGLGRGGAENQVKILTEFLDIKNLYTLINQNDTEVKNPLPKVLLKKETKSRLIRLINSIYKLNRIYKPEGIIISFMEQSNFVNIISNLLGNKHFCLISVRISPSYYEEKKFGWIMLFIMKTLYPYADLIISNSEECGKELKSLLNTDPKKIITIPNIIHHNIPINKQFFKLSSDTLVTIGRLEPQKNIEFQIQLISYFRKNNLLGKLIIIGDGSLKMSLISLAKNLKLRVGFDLNNEIFDIIFLGQMDEPMKILNKKSIFILTSFYEGMPNVILEAMSRGAVVISSNCKTGPKELLSPKEIVNSDQYFYEFGCILPVPYDNEKNLIIWSSLLSKILNSQKIREKYSLKSIQRYDQFTPDKIIPVWKKAIHNFL